jgi:hypothetical protein
MKDMTEVRHVLNKIHITKAQNEETTQQQTTQSDETTI